MLIHETLKEKNLLGLFRNLETNKRLWVPTKTNIQLLVSAIDVLHSWAVPSFGVKLDACPGRLFSTFIWLKQVGVFFGQCSEICWRLDMFNSAEKSLNMFIFSINCFIRDKRCFVVGVKVKKKSWYYKVPCFI